MPTSIGDNLAKAKLAAGDLVLCLAINQMRTPNIAMIAAACGFDAIFVDLEHNPTSLETTSALCVGALAMGVTPIVRASSQDPAEAARLLDGGAQGLMIPHVGSRQEAEQIVTAC